MKKTLAILSVSLLLVISLAACGETTGNKGGTDKQNTAQNQDNGQNTDNNGTSNNTGTTGDTGHNVTGSIIGGIAGAGRSAADGMTNGGMYGTNNGTGVTDNSMASPSGRNTTNGKANAYGNTNATANAQLRGNSRSVTGTQASAGTTLSGDEQYARMLANARVHDTDGFLLDGENSHYATW